MLVQNAITESNCRIIMNTQASSKCGQKWIVNIEKGGGTAAALLTSRPSFTYIWHKHISTTHILINVAHYKVNYNSIQQIQQSTLGKLKYKYKFMRSKHEI